MSLRRGPMPPAMRLAVLALFAGVFGMMVLPVLVGVPLFVGQTAVVVAEHAPIEDDHRIAEELEERAALYGEQLEVDAVDIAYARRLGQLDVIEEVAAERFPTAPPPVTNADQAPQRHFEGAFYRDEAAPEPSHEGLPWRWVVLAFGGIVVSFGAVGAAFASLLGSPDEEEPAL